MELKKALPLLKQIAGNNKTLSILQTIKLDKNELSATDLETTVTIKIDNLNIENQTIVNAKLFDGVISSLKTKDITIKNETIDKLNILTVNEFKLPTQPIDEYPCKPITDNQIKILTANQSLINDLIIASKFTNKEDGREPLANILFNLINQTITATDSYKLIEKKVKIKTLLTDETELKQKIGGIYTEAKNQKFINGFLFPIKIINLLAKLKALKMVVNEITISCNKDNLIINIDNIIEIIQRKLENSTYPDTQSIINNNQPYQANVSYKIIPQELLQKLDPVKIYTKNQDKDIIPIQFNYEIPNQLTIMIDNKEMGVFEQILQVENFKYDLPLLKDGINPQAPAYKIAFNYDFFITCLKTMQQDNEALISIQEPLKPITITNADESIIILLMPYRIK